MAYDSLEYEASNITVQREEVVWRSTRSVAGAGFFPRWRRVHRAYNLAVSTLLFAMTLPLFATITVLLLATQGRKVFYRGVRIGEGGRKFGIIKFRTLDDEGSRLLTKNCVLPSGTGIETPLGLFLRETRLDELPQLLNVVLGDMNICGPRPVRPEIAAISRRNIRQYDVRFLVKPGLIGPTQACLGHGTSKVIRARYNNQLCQAPVSYSKEFGLVFIVGCCVLARTASRLWSKIFRPLLGFAPEDAAAVRAASLDVHFVNDNTRSSLPATKIDHHTLTLAGALPAGSVEHSGSLALTLPDGQRRYATVALEATGRLAAPGQFVYRYEVRGDFANHIVSRYLFQAVVVPHRSHFLGVRLYRLASRMWQRKPTNDSGQGQNVSVSATSRA